MVFLIVFKILGEFTIYSELVSESFRLNFRKNHLSVNFL
jgi:hypothetical protein